MMNLVSFIICLIAVAESEVQNTTGSFSLIYAKRWYINTGYRKDSDVSELLDKIFFKDDSIIEYGNDEHKENTNKRDHTDYNNEGNHTTPISYNNSTNNSNTLLAPVKETNNFKANIEFEKLFPEGNTSDRAISKMSSGEPGGRSDVLHCTERNERYPVPGFCDSYIQCQNGKPEEKQCPDGLRYKHNLKPDEYPCQYPADVQCSPGYKLQPPKPTDVCPNQFGYFKTEDRLNCSNYRICENGIGYDYKCPNGLAFNIRSSRCEWPDRVPECDVQAFLGFRCPDVPTSNTVRCYRSPRNCTVYYFCSNGKPRRLECDEYFAFNERIQRCVPAYEVLECTPSQKNIAMQSVKRTNNGEYKIRLFDQDYLEHRNQPLQFRPKIKSRPKTIQ